MSKEEKYVTILMKKWSGFTYCKTNQQINDAI